MSSKLRNILSNHRDTEREHPASKSHAKSRDKQQRHKERRRSSQGKKSTSTKDRDSVASAHSTSSASTGSRPRRRRSMPEVESAVRSETPSILGSRTSLPYPSFSKAHSRQSLWDKDDDGIRKVEVVTPDPTDVVDGEGNKEKKSSSSSSSSRTEGRSGAPPSPPLTAEQRSSRKGSTSGKTAKESDKGKKKKVQVEATSSTTTSQGKKKEDLRSSTKSPRPGTPVESRVKSRNSVTSKSSKSRSHDDGPKRSSSRKSLSQVRSSGKAESTDSTYDSDATSIPLHQTKPPSRSHTRSSTSRDGIRRQSSIEVTVDNNDKSPTREQTLPQTPPPPPPPPLQMPIPPARVDYLLKNGGLPYQVPKHLLGAENPSNMPDVQPYPARVTIFDPFHRLLDDYSQVIAKNGSLAVATGYRSVARRLLDRLEAVFARDISSETCACPLCVGNDNVEVSPGVSWGEVLELVSGRRELPSWPPFQITASVKDSHISGEEHIPMQKLDIDVPEEYREHYIRQSRKTKEAVDKWLLGQTEQSPLPEDVDDETLTFAMMTHLDPEHREQFCLLLGIPSGSSSSTTLGSRERPEFLESASLATQRLYRLVVPPRDCETAIYMVKNWNIHNVLATLAAISNDEWDILISGRFDGFLRSGVEDTFTPSISASAPPPAAAGSRSSTPFPRGSTPSDPYSRPVSQPYGSYVSSPSSGGPIALDEEREIAALAEIERDIYLSMEALEDAFEALHNKAEAVRRALRERGASLSLANQARRGSAINLDARLGTPASMAGSWDARHHGGLVPGYDDDDGIDDEVSLAPDDSASNISSNRRRRPKRRTERRTPALVEEEEEENDHVSTRRERRT